MTMTPQQRHEQAIERLEFLKWVGFGPDDEQIKFWLRENDIAVAAFYDKTVEQLETNIQVCWR